MKVWSITSVKYNESNVSLFTEPMNGKDQPFKEELNFLKSLKTKFVCKFDDTEVKVCNQNIAFSTGKYKMHHQIHNSSAYIRMDQIVH